VFAHLTIFINKLFTFSNLEINVTPNFKITTKKMKINDLIFRYSFPNNWPKDGLCRVRTFINSRFQVYVLITDLGVKNTSASVTNSIEIICESLKTRLIVPETSIFIEHYEPSSVNDHTFDIITIEKGNEPKWENINLSEAKCLLDCDDEELDNLSLENKFLLDEIDKTITQINPHLDLPRQLESDYILRGLEIQKNMVPKLSLIELVEKNSKEIDFLNLLKKDLSLFAEVYASPSDNYICFAEFPLNGGFVDFVLLTGTSRMDVFLIEIKGAEFNILNKGSYEKFNAKIDRAVVQITDRLGYIHRNNLEFRKNIHMIRERVVGGESLFNSFIGPDKTTRVDKNKDINIHNVIIGGRTIDDIKESYKRQNFEYNFNLPIKLESWETFIRKLRRN